MRLILALFLTFIYIFAENIDFNSIDSNFTQTITSPEGSTLEYEGNFYAKKPNYALWHYTKPVDKSIYFLDKNILVVEPELEQVIISKVPDIPNISNLLKSAKKVSKDTYKTTYKDRDYTIFIEGDKPKNIKYIDKLENNVSINFFNTKTNLFLDDVIFKYAIPKEYDIINQ